MAQHWAYELEKLLQIFAMAIAKPGPQRQELLDVNDHDVRRLDLLTSDIFTTLRLDSDFVKEQEKPFKLVPMIATASHYLAEQAAQRCVALVTESGPAHSSRWS